MIAKGNVNFGEIISLYFLPEYMGKGYGKLLLQAAASELKKMGFDKVFLWVLEENQNARHFYEKCGFVQTECYLYSNIGGKELKEVQYCYQDYMTEIHLMTAEHAYWKETISFVERCSWNAGSFLARKMQENEFKELERVCAVCVNGKVAGFSTFTERDELSEQYDFTPFIGFIFVDEQFRGRRLSEMMIQSIISYAKELRYEKVYIMSGEIGLYEKYGFVKLGDYKTVYGSTDQLFVQSIEGAK